MAAVIDSPDFMLHHVGVNNLGISKKIYLFLKGLIVGFVYKNFDKRIFCYLLNILFLKSQKLKYENGKYSVSYNDYWIFFPNKRVVRMFLKPEVHLKTLYDSYCLHTAGITDGDLIIDCGANIGELYYSFLINEQKIQYFAFEPEWNTYSCLEENLNKFSNVKLYNLALSNDTKTSQLFVDKEGANSSLSNFGSSERKEVSTNKLDEFKLQSIKLLKVEAEGHELEVLEGSINTLSKTEFVSIDYGPEKGLDQVSTLSDVVNFMYKNNFSLIETSKYRQIGLFKNNNL
tara:strand:+ start:34464 stop:35327 length:864 start_codon:yes stop_codon:yes gene_type:complete